MFSRIIRPSTTTIRVSRPRTLQTLCRPRPALPLRPQQQQRNVTNYRLLLEEARNGGLRRNWMAITIFTALISAAIGSGVYYVYLYNELVEKPLSVYPPAASSQIKSALYHASRGNVAEMASSFKTAIAAAEAAGMHPLSDEVAGLKIECAQFLLKMKDGAYAEKGAQVLEHVLDESAAGAEFFEKEGRRRDRNKVLMRAVLLGYKIGEIYQGLGKDKEAGEAMAWSTETLLKETKRREETKVDEKEEGDWFDDVAMSACFEKLALQYEKTSQHYLATPLYLKALSLVPAHTCHAVTLMNNLSACLSRQKSPPASSAAGALPSASREQLLSNAQKWAEKALEIDAKIGPPVRTPECNEACVAATYNLGEIARMLGKKKLAMEKFEEALSLAKGLGMAEGVEAAREGLQKTRIMNEGDVSFA